jgi:beta-lactamase class A
MTVFYISRASCPRSQARPSIAHIGWFLGALLSALALIPSPLAAQETTSLASAETAEPSIPLQARASDVIPIIKGEMPPEEAFAANFLKAIPPAQFALVSAQIQAQFGAPLALIEVTPTNQTTANIAIRFERAIGRGLISIEPAPPHKITGLMLSQFDEIGDNAAKIEADLQALPGEVSAYFGPLDGSEPRIAIAADTQLAIGSTFKLYVLSALQREISEGKRRWHDVLPLTRRSYPSGQMQDWPLGSPVTLYTLAGLMISVSDNTATDQLIAELGRETIEREMALIGHSDIERNQPFLKTIELFGLKGSPENAEKYINGDLAKKRFLLRDFEDDIGGNADNLPVSQLSEPTYIDSLEWFANADDLRRLMLRFAGPDSAEARAILSINPAMSDSRIAQWSYAGFKGGSEPGVLNLTWLLIDGEGQPHILTLSWNNPDAVLDDAKLIALANRIMGLPR